MGCPWYLESELLQNLNSESLGLMGFPASRVYRVCPALWLYRGLAEFSGFIGLCRFIGFIGFSRVRSRPASWIGGPPCYRLTVANDSSSIWRDPTHLLLGALAPMSVSEGCFETKTPPISPSSWFTCNQLQVHARGIRVRPLGSCECHALPRFTSN